MAPCSAFTRSDDGYNANARGDGFAIYNSLTASRFSEYCGQAVPDSMVPAIRFSVTGRREAIGIYQGQPKRLSTVVHTFANSHGDTEAGRSWIICIQAAIPTKPALGSSCVDPLLALAGRGEDKKVSSEARRFQYPQAKFLAAGKGVSRWALHDKIHVR